MESKIKKSSDILDKEVRGAEGLPCPIPGCNGILKMEHGANSFQCSRCKQSVASYNDWFSMTGYKVVNAS